MTPGMRDEHAVCTLDDCFILFGGYIGGRMCSNDLLMYVYDEKKWYTMDVAGEIAPTPRAGSSIVWNRNQLTIFGGKDEEGNRLNDLWQYDFDSREWKSIDRYNYSGFEEFNIMSRSGHTAFIYKNRMAVYGGIHEITKELDDLCLLDFN